MNPLDLVVLAVIGLFGTAWGFWKGALRQVLDAVAFVFALLSSWALAAPVARTLGGATGDAFHIRLLVAAVGVFLFAYVLVKLIWSVWLKLLEKKNPDGSAVLSVTNRLLGGVLGTFRMGIVVWTLLSVVAIVQGKVAQAKAALLAKVPGAAETPPKEAPKPQVSSPDHSALYAFVADHNLIDLVFRQRLQQVQQLAADLHAGKKRAVDGFDTLAKDERLHAIAKDAALRKALETGDLAAVARHPAIISLLADSDTMAKIAAALQGAVVQSGQAADKHVETAKKGLDAARQAADEAARKAKEAVADAPAAVEDLKKAVEEAVPAAP